MPKSFLNLKDLSKSFKRKANIVCLILMVFFIYISCQIRTSTYNISQLILWESSNSSSSYSYTAEINKKRSVLPLTLSETGMATSAKYFIIKKGAKEITSSSTSTDARNVSRHFQVPSFSFSFSSFVK